MRRLACPTLLVLLSFACVVNTNQTSSGAPPSDNDDPGPATKPNTTGSEVSEPEVEGDPPARASTPEPAACPADADADTYCTDDKLLAGRWALVDTIHPPATAEVIFEAKHMDIKEQPSLTISLDGETLYIERVTCGSCRRVMGQGFSGDLSMMNDTQRRAVQNKLGLGRDVPVLGSAEAWRSYASQDPGKAALTKLSTSTTP